MVFKSLGLVSTFVALSMGAPAHAIPESPKAPLVFVEKAKEIPIFDSLSYPARLVPKVNASVLSETDGMVVKILAPLGKPVNRNEGILQVRHTDPLYDYAAVTVRSPVKGIVSSVDVTEGSRVTKGQKILSITDPSRVKIVIEVATVDTMSVKAGMLGELSVPSDDTKYPVRVRGISPFVDPASGTATAELEFAGKADQAPPLPPGLVASVNFRVKEHKGIQVPEHAVVYRGEGSFVRVLREGKATYQAVTVGPMRRGTIEIVKGISPGTEIILRSNTYIAEGEAVTVDPGDAQVGQPSE